MRGLISDIHGNTVALDAVIADGTEQGVSEWWVLGTCRDRPNRRDARAPGQSPPRASCGNTDRYTVTGERNLTRKTWRAMSR
jgi:hypothetical protein